MEATTRPADWPADVDGFWYFTCAGVRPGQTSGVCGELLRADYPRKGEWTQAVTCPVCGREQRATWTLFRSLSAEQRAALTEDQARLRARWHAREGN
jgi:hypothetical protein